MNAISEVEDDLIDEKDLCKFLGYKNVQALRQSRCNGRDVPDTFTVGARRVIRKAVLEAWLKKKEREKQ